MPVRCRTPGPRCAAPQMGIPGAIAGLFGRKAKKEWPAIGGTTGYHRGAGRWPPPAVYPPKKAAAVVESWYDSGLRLTAPEPPKAEEPKPVEEPKAEEPKPAKQSLIQAMKGVVKPTKPAETPASEQQTL
eukprot:1737505-Prymnesium_polylepis.1